MRVMELTDWNADAIQLVHRDRPACPPDGVVVQMQAASLNFRDTVLVQRGYGRISGTLPLVPVSDGAGTIVEVGGDVSGFATGDLVTPYFFQDWSTGPFDKTVGLSALGGMRPGVMQEYMALSANHIARAPSHFNALQAATLPVAALTAWNAIVESGAVGGDDVVVIQGTGGVSLFALQFAALRGATTILLSSDDAKLEKARGLGATHCVNYVEHPEWSKVVRELTGGSGASHIVEVGGAGTLDQSLRSVTAGGTISLIGVLSGIKPELNLGPIITQNIRLQGITVGNHEMHRAMVSAIEESGLDPAIDDKVVGFEDVGEAIKSFGRGGHFGKVCIDFAT